MEAAADTALPLGDTPQPVTETKAEAFDRMAPARVTRAIDHIRLVGNLANRSTYAYSDEDVAQIMAAMRTAVNDAESKFRSNSPRPSFQLRR